MWVLSRGSGGGNGRGHCHLKRGVLDVRVRPVLPDFLSMPQVFISEVANWGIITRFFYEFPVHAAQRSLPAVAAPASGFQLSRAIVKDHHDVRNMQAMLAVYPFSLTGSECARVRHENDATEADVFAEPVVGDGV